MVKTPALRVLIVDDEKSGREHVTKAILHSVPGAEVVAVPGASEMDAALAKGLFDLITMDGFLDPSRSEYGPSLVSHLRAKGVMTPILMISSDERALRSGVSNGANGMLDKTAVTYSAFDDFPDVLRPELVRLGLIK